mgnify:CR=1 FL=1
MREREATPLTTDTVAVYEVRLLKWICCYCSQRQWQIQKYSVEVKYSPCTRRKCLSRGQTKCKDRLENPQPETNEYFFFCKIEFPNSKERQAEIKNNVYRKVKCKTKRIYRHNMYFTIWFCFHILVCVLFLFQFWEPMIHSFRHARSLDNLIAGNFYFHVLFSKDFYEILKNLNIYIVRFYAP